MKHLITIIFAALFAAVSFADTETVNGVTYTFVISNGEATIGSSVDDEGGSLAIPKSTSGALIIPSILGGCPVTTIGKWAFAWCDSLTSVTIPEGVTTIGSWAFGYCSSLKSVTIPSSVTTIGDCVFNNCTSLTSVRFEGEIPTIGSLAFSGSPWYEKGVYRLLSNASAEGAGGVANTVTVKQEVTHYVLNSVQPSFVIPATYDTGFVNVIAEVKGGCVAIPATWTVNYPKFTEKFGSDFTKALSAKTGKIAAGGREMLVWEDYVAGTDPTDPNDKFTASMTMVDGKAVISWTPELDADRAALRKYTTYGKVKLTDSEWTVVEDGRASDYNFFKVTVEMK